MDFLYIYIMVIVAEQLGLDIVGSNVSDQFGHSVSLSSDGSRVAAGAPYFDYNGNNNTGLVRVYDWRELFTPALFFRLPTKQLDDPPFDIQYGKHIFSNSDGAIRYISLRKNVASVSGNTVTLTGTGTGRILAKQFASGNYMETSKIALLNVQGEDPVIHFTLPQKTFGDPPFRILENEHIQTNVTVSGFNRFTYTSLHPRVATVFANQITIVGAGEATIQAILYYNNETYLQTATLVVNPSVPIMTISLPTKTFGDLPFPIARGRFVTTNSDAPITFTSSVHEVATILNNDTFSTITIHGAGTTVITAQQPVYENYDKGGYSVE